MLNCTINDLLAPQYQKDAALGVSPPDPDEYFAKTGSYYYSPDTDLSRLPGREEGRRAFILGYLRRAAEHGWSIKEAADNLRVLKQWVRTRDRLLQHHLSHAVKEHFGGQSGYSSEKRAGIGGTSLKYTGAVLGKYLPLLAILGGTGLGFGAGYALNRLFDYPPDVYDHISDEEMIREYKRQKRLLEQGKNLTF